MNGDPGGVSDIKLGVYAALLLAFWAGVAAWTAHPALPPNPIEMPFDGRNPVAPLLPQGWSFFTRNPRLPETFAFVRGDHGLWVLAASVKAGRAVNLGFDRSSKLVGVEAALIIREVPDAKWHPCRDPPVICLQAASVTATVRSEMPAPLLCGEVGFVSREPVPWAWSRASRQVVMPSEVLRLRVLC